MSDGLQPASEGYRRPGVLAYGEFLMGEAHVDDRVAALEFGLDERIAAGGP